ncbi:response regulator [Litorisediminicola beolgyonensis]|uniref:Response regulator n=1 Tax=Litorisediminicola beolgyonensis TaxID=1173614 RepID=A0ABW3ZGH6_9RHOB
MDQDFFGDMCRPTMARPLLGLTVLVVEDSRYACDAMQLMCIRSGARIRRADCLASARRHLAVYRPSAVIVDMGLPDGSGADLLSEMRIASPRVSVILATSGDPFAEKVAIAAGADGFLAKPLASLAAFQNAILAELPPDRRPNGPRSVETVEIAPDPVAYRDDLAHAADLLDPLPEGAEVDYVARFLSGVARSAEDTALGPPVARLRHLLAERLTERIAI